jgi:hypothetical protein
VVDGSSCQGSDKKDSSPVVCSTSSRQTRRQRLNTSFSPSGNHASDVCLLKIDAAVVSPPSNHSGSTCSPSVGRSTRSARKNQKKDIPRQSLRFDRAEEAIEHASYTQTRDTEKPGNVGTCKTSYDETTGSNEHFKQECEVTCKTIQEKKERNMNIHTSTALDLISHNIDEVRSHTEIKDSSTFSPNEPKASRCYEGSDQMETRFLRFPETTKYGHKFTSRKLSYRYF